MPNSKEVATISVGGKTYSSWKSISIRREVGTDAAFSFFQFTASEAAVAHGDVLKLQPDMPCTISLGGAPALTGEISVRLATYDKESHDLIISGRSQVHHLQSSVKVDNQTSGLYNGYTFEQALRGAMAPHPVQLVMKNAPAIASKPFPYLVVQLGESVLEFGDRMAKMRGMLLSDDAQGNLVAGLGGGSSSGAQLEEGVNILRASGKLDNQLMFTNRFYGQKPSTDDDAPARPYAATAENPAAASNKQTTYLAEHPADAQDLQARADLKSRTDGFVRVDVDVTVQGWFRPDGKLWEIYDVVTVKSPMLFPTDDGSMPLGIRAVTFAQDGEQEGTTTTLSLTQERYLTQTGGDPGVSTNSSGDFVDKPGAGPAQPDSPDYQGGQQ